MPALFSRWAASFFATVTKGGNISMGKVRRGNYVFLTWKGDHSPRHVQKVFCENSQSDSK